MPWQNYIPLLEGYIPSLARLFLKVFLMQRARWSSASSLTGFSDCARRLIDYPKGFLLIQIIIILLDWQFFDLF